MQKHTPFQLTKPMQQSEQPLVQLRTTHQMIKPANKLCKHKEDANVIQRNIQKLAIFPRNKGKRGPLAAVQIRELERYYESFRRLRDYGLPGAIHL